MIHFSKDQVRWECYCLAASEVYPNGLNESDVDLHGLPAKSTMVELWKDAKSTHALWNRIREEYS